MKETLLKTELKDLENKYGPMVEPMRATGVITWCTAKVNFRGQMGDHTREITYSTKNMAKESSSGAMVGATKEAGYAVNNMG